MEFLLSFCLMLASGATLAAAQEDFLIFQPPNGERVAPFPFPIETEPQFPQFPQQPQQPQFPQQPQQPVSSTTPTSIPDWVVVNNRPTIGTMAPFVTQPPPTRQFLDCFGSCPTTSEYNPICGSNMQLYMNEQKFNCAVSCGADIQIVRRGSCEGLFQMQRG